ncbi:MAG: hypothetical protein K2X66_06025, partial [Cyanobacteria bacterium]|nr:hypothetical protein [Cyanobacteriota bacterium]
CYPVPSDLELKFLNCLTCAPIDFSHFFRLYPILRRSPDWSLALGMENLVTCVKEFPDFDWKELSPQDGDEAFFKRTVLKKLDQYFIHSREELVELSLGCVEFIQWYDLLFQKIQTLLHTDGSHDPGAVEVHAYCINQDRLHLFMPYSMAGPLDDEKNELSPEEINQRIETAILSNRRTQPIREDMFNYSNMALFKEGYFATLHNEQHQHQLRLTVFKSPCPSLLKEILDLEPIPLNDEDFVVLFEVSVNHQRFPCSAVKSREGEFSLQSPWRDNLDLIPPGYTEITFYFKNKPIIFQNIQFSFTKRSHTQNFASCLYPLWEG